MNIFKLVLFFVRVVFPTIIFVGTMIGTVAVYYWLAGEHLPIVNTVLRCIIIPSCVFSIGTFIAIVGLVVFSPPDK